MTILGFAGRWPERVDPQAQRLHLQRCLAAPGGPGPRPVELAGGWVAAPAVHRAGPVCVAVQGKPVWPESRDLPADTNPAAALHAAYSSHGRAFLERLEGSFAIAIVDEAAGSVLLAIDRMGIERMAWTTVGGTIAFGSSAEHLARLPAVDAPLRRQGLYDFLMMHMIPAPDTIYAGVHKLRAATMLTFADGRTEVATYWRPRFVERGAESFEALRDELHASLDEAIRDARPNGT